jgi:CO dehydrogenase/acetyl-CoA synthase beta subunit
MRGVRASLCEGRLVLDLAADTALTPARIGEALIAAVRHEFPKIARVRAEVILDPQRLRALCDGVRAEQTARDAEVAAATEESLEAFATCVGCSPFAPDHACVLTPQRPPQCNRTFARIKAGALYQYDEMTHIHHRTLHAGINSYGVCPKGEAVDPIAGEWAGVNEAVSRLTGGRTTRVQLHSLDEAPHTGCSCFQLIMFQTDRPAPGIGIMRRGYDGMAPDGRTWRDLHYALTGKQTPGMAGAGLAYLRSPKFLAAHGGWDAVVWVSPEIAAHMGAQLPTHTGVGAADTES